MANSNFKQEPFDFYQKQDFTSTDSVIQQINSITRASLEAMNELNITYGNASLLAISTLQIARQIFDSHFKDNTLDTHEALWHSYAQAYTLRVQHELDQLGLRLIQSISIDPLRKVIERGMHEFNFLVKKKPKKG
jgi:hypothetical protein